MKILPVFLFLGILLAPEVWAGNENTPAGGRSSAMGSASVALNDFWSVYNNQAGLSGFKDIAAGAYFENRFLMKEMSRKVIAVVMPSHSGVFGLSFNNFGSSLYSENKAGIAFARSFGSNFSAGLQLDYLHTHIAEGYGNHSSITFEAGFQTRVNRYLILAAHVYNPLNTKFSADNDERLPSVVRMGAAYSFSDKLTLAGEAEKNIDQKLQIKSGVEYRIVDKAIARAGVTANPMTYTFGFGLDLQKLKIDLSSTVHEVLGYSPQISICYYF